MQWLMFQMGGVGPMMGQANVFFRYAPEKIPYAIERYQREARRLFEVMERQLEDNDVHRGQRVLHRRHRAVELGRGLRVVGRRASTDCPALKRWLDLVGARPAVQKGRAVPPPPTPEERAKTVESAKNMLA